MHRIQDGALCIHVYQAGHVHCPGRDTLEGRENKRMEPLCSSYVRNQTGRGGYIWAQKWVGGIPPIVMY